MPASHSPQLSAPFSADKLSPVFRPKGGGELRFPGDAAATITVSARISNVAINPGGQGGPAPYAGTGALVALYARHADAGLELVAYGYLGATGTTMTTLFVVSGVGAAEWVVLAATYKCQVQVAYDVLPSGSAGASVTMLAKTAPGNWPGETLITAFPGPGSDVPTGTDDFPPAAALSDAIANPTTTLVGSNLLGFTGAVWARIRAGIIAGGSPLGFLNTLAGLIYNATVPTLTDGQAITLQGDSQGNAKVTQATNIAGEDLTNQVLNVSPKARADATNAWTTGTQSAKSAAFVIKASAGRLRRLVVTNTAGGAQLVALINKATTPANGDSWQECPVSLAAGASYTWDFGAEGQYFGTGIAVAEITVANGTITIAGTADLVASFEYA